MLDRSEDQETLAARIAAPLRVPERADPTLVGRVMGAVRDEGRGTRDESAAAHQPSPWWRRSVEVRLTVLRGLALAAGLAAVAISADLLLQRPFRGTGTSHDVATPRDTVYVVRFVFGASGVSSVAIVGDFNRWDVNAHQLVQAGADGTWSVSVPLTAGRHEYAFVVDGTRWVADPSAARALADEFGGQSSVITLGRAAGLRSG